MVFTDPRPLRCDEIEIAKLVSSESRVLDIGCGDGSLLSHLKEEKKIDGRGIELSQEGVNLCVSKGLSVIQGDADTDLKDYPDNVFDFVILSQTLQATRNPKDVVKDLIRIGKKAIVTFPNFGFYKLRLKSLIYGEMPKTTLLSHTWYNTPNIHLCTILDFTKLCKQLEINLNIQIILNEQGKKVWVNKNIHFSNIFGEQGLFVLSKKVK